jgi:hypothetical protein
MPGIQLIATDELGSSGVVTSMTNNVSSLVQPGDMLVFSVAGQTATVPAGVPTGFSTLNVSNTTALYLANWYKFWTVSDMGTTTVASGTLTSTRHASMLQIIRNVDLLQPFDTVVGNAQAGTTTTTTTGITPATQGAWILGLVAQTFASGTTPGALASSNMNVDADIFSTAAAAVNVLCGVMHQPWSGSGAFTPNASNSAATVRTLFQRTALKPSPAMGWGVAA